MIVTDRRGRLLADSAGSGLRLSSYADRPEIAAALAGNPDQGTRHSDDARRRPALHRRARHRRRVVASAPFGSRRASTRSGAGAPERARRRRRRARGAGARAGARLGAGRLARRARCAALARTARRVEDGELDARAEIVGAREQREVAMAFNDMTDRLAQALEAQREFVGNASHQLRTPLTGLRLRLEAAGLKTADPAVERELAARRGGGRAPDPAPERAPHAGAGGRPARAARARLAAAASRRRRSSAGCRGRRRPDTELELQGDERCLRPGRGGGRRDRARQPDRERARLLAAGDDA